MASYHGPRGKLDISDDDKLFYGSGDDTSVRFDPSVGANGAYIVRDEINDQDRLEIRVGDVTRLLDQDVEFPDGDLAHPGIAFVNDPDTGFHRSAADTIQIVTGGDAEAEVTSGGDLNLEGVLTESTTV